MGEGGGDVCVAMLDNGIMEVECQFKAELKPNCESVMDGATTEPCAEMQADEVPIVPRLELCTESPVKEAMEHTELDLNDKTPANDGMNDTSLELCADSKGKEALNATEFENHPDSMATKVYSDSEFEPCARSLAVEASTSIKLQLSDEKQEKEALNDNNELELADKKYTKEGLNNCELENGVKEASNEDVFSEVSNPNFSPRDITSSIKTISSHSVRNRPGGCGEVSSLCSGSSSEEESLSEGDHTGKNGSGEASKSCVVLEIPKHVSTTGIRKITFKFGKRKEDYEHMSSVSDNQSLSNEFHDGFHEVYAPYASVDDYISDMNPNMCRGLFCNFAPDRELKMSKKVVPDCYPTNVKKLLSTGILEGARVKYISIHGKRELSGIIRDDGYLCGCSTCNFSRVLSAYEFELHAGGKTRHPNNHIYLENGKPIYNIIQELKTAPLSMLDEVIKQVAGSSVNEEHFQVWKANLQQNNEMAGDVDMHGQTFSTDRYDTSYPSQVMDNKLTHGSGFCTYSYPLDQYSCMETAERRKRVVKKTRLFSPSSVVKQNKFTDGGTKKRDNDLHKLLFMPNGLPDGTDLAYYSKGKKILGGYKQGNGIVCSCCHGEVSPSQFEAHAGWAAKRQPYRHIYTSSGLTLHDIALMLANGRNLATGNSDDMCAVCGEAGELIICDGCPRAFHAACLGLQCGPARDWKCPYCLDKIVPARKATGKSKPFNVRRVVKAPEHVGGGCVLCRAPDFSVAKFDDRTVLLCDQCEKEYHVGCLRISGLCDLKELPMDKWFCCVNCNKIYMTLKNFVSNGADVIPASVSATISKKHIEKGLPDVASNDIQWRILSGKSRYPEHLPLLSRAAAIFRECFDPIVAKCGRDLIPIMVYGRNISGQEFGGMYCVVLIVKSVVVSAALLRVFGQEVAELPLVATSKENQGKGYFQALFSCIERLLFSMDVKKLVLPAAEEAESIWTKKLGFKKISNERMRKYSKELQLTVFKGTSMLEKGVHPEGY